MTCRQIEQIPDYHKDNHSQYYAENKNLNLVSSIDQLYLAMVFVPPNNHSGKRQFCINLAAADTSRLIFLECE